MAKTTKTNVAKPDSYPGQHLQLDAQKLLAWKNQISEALDANPAMANKFSISPEGVRSYLTLNRQVNRKFVTEATEITGVELPDGLLTNRSSAPAKPAPVRRTKSDTIQKVEASDVDGDAIATALLKSGFAAYRDGGDVLILDTNSQDDGDVLVEVTVRRIVRATRSKGQLRYSENLWGEAEAKPIGRIELIR